MKLLLAGFNTRAFAESFVRAGFRVEAVDCFGDMDHRRLCRVHPVLGAAGGPGTMADVAQKVLDLLDGGQYDCFGYTSGFENQPAYLTEIQKKGVRLLGNSPEANARVRDIFTLGKMLRKQGFCVPAVAGTEGLGNDRAAACAQGSGGAEVVVGGPEGATNARAVAGVEAASCKRVAGRATPGSGSPTLGPGLPQKGCPSPRWLVKPLAGGGGRGIEFISHPEPVPEGYFAQEYVPGKACSFAFLAIGGRSRLLGVSEQLVGHGSGNGREFAYSGNIFPLDLPADRAVKMWNELCRLAEWLAKTYELAGLNGVDFIYDGEKCWFIEVNPRYTASMELMEIAGGVSVAGSHFDACRGILPAENHPACFSDGGRYRAGSAASRLPFYGKKIIYADRDVQISYPQAADKAWIGKLHTLGIRDIPHEREQIRKGSPVATVLAQGQSRDECVHRLGEMALVVKNFTGAPRPGGEV